MATGKKKKRVRKEPEVRRTELMDAARKLFLEKGYRSTSVDDIVKAAGVSKGTYYLYFDSKQDVLAAIVEGVQSGILVGLGEVMASGANPRDKLLLGLDRAFAQYERNEDILQVFELAGPEAAHERMKSHGWNESKPMLKALLEQGLTDGLFEVDDMDGTIDIIMVLVSELQHLVISPYSNITADSGMRLLEKVLDGLLRKH